MFSYLNTQLFNIILAYFLGLISIISKMGITVPYNASNWLIYSGIFISPAKFFLIVDFSKKLGYNFRNSKYNYIMLLLNH